MKILKQITLILAVCLAGEGISRLLPFPVPGSIVGLLLLLALLFWAGKKGKDLTGKTGRFMLDNIQVFLVPSSVSLMTVMDIVGEQLAVILFICMVTTVVTFAATAYTVTLVMAVQNRKRGGRQ